MSRREGGMSRARPSSSAAGSMTAVMVTWWVTADSSPTAGTSVPSARPSRPPARRATAAASASETPVWCSAALSTRMLTSTTAGSLPRPASAWAGDSRPLAASARTIRIATRSLRGRSVASRTKAPSRIAKNTSCAVVIGGRPEHAACQGVVAAPSRAGATAGTSRAAGATSPGGARPRSRARRTAAAPCPSGTSRGSPAGSRRAPACRWWRRSRRR